MKPKATMATRYWYKFRNIQSSNWLMLKLRSSSRNIELGNKEKAYTEKKYFRFGWYIIPETSQTNKICSIRKVIFRRRSSVQRHSRQSRYIVKCSDGFSSVRLWWLQFVVLPLKVKITGVCQIALDETVNSE